MHMIEFMVRLETNADFRHSGFDWMSGRARWMNMAGFKAGPVKPIVPYDVVVKAGIRKGNELP